MKRINVLFFIAGILLIVLILILSKKPPYNRRSYTRPSPTIQSQTFPSQIEAVGEINIEVKPKLTQTSWNFEITLNTHSVELDQDLQKKSVLIDDKNNEYPPLSWEGDPPGGHHRKGILKFAAISPKPDFVELIITAFAEKKTFKWDL